MSRTQSGISVSALLLFHWYALAQGSRSQVYVMEGARLIVGDGAAIESSAFTFTDGKFTQVGKKGELKLPRGAIEIDLTGKTVIPGLIDAHAHLGYADYRLWTDGKQNYTRENLVDHLQRAAYFGLSAIFSAGTDVPPLCFEVRDEVLAGQVPNAARFVTAGPGLTAPDMAKPELQRQDAYAVTTPEQARQAVRELASHNVQILKAWVNGPGGGIDSSKEPMDPAIYTAFITEAHAHSMRVFLHARIPQEVKGLVRAGADGFAHEIDEGSPPGPDAELLALLKGRGRQIYMTLTLPAFPGGEADRFRGPEPLLIETVPREPLSRLRQQALALPNDEKAQNDWKARKELTKKLIATGIRIGVGSDADHLRPTMVGWAVHTEMEEMVASGMTPADVIVAATKTNAEWLGLNDLGSIAAGKSASFVVLDANPLDDIRNTRRIRSVYLNGKQVDRPALRSAWEKYR